MPRKIGLGVLCIAIITSVILFVYNIQYFSHSSATATTTPQCSPKCTLSPSVDPTSTSTPTPTSIPSFMQIPGYTLAWNDEFNGTQVNTSKWFVVNSQGGPQQQGCCLDYTYDSLISPNQVQIHDGMLTITTERSTSGGPAYKTGAITTETRSDQPTFTFTYGRIDIRAKLPTGRGIWPAMWLVTSPATTQVSYEIDMMEMLGQDPHTLYQVVHHDGAREYCSEQGPDYSQAFHVYSLDWEPGKLVWSIDGQTVCAVTKYVPNQPMYLILNTAISGGEWGEPINSATLLPQTFDIDYVRIYKRNPQ